MKVNKILQGVLLFFGVLILCFAFLYSIVEPMVQDAYKKGYDKGKNETCKFIISNGWTGDNPTNKEIKIKINYSLNLTLN